MVRENRPIEQKDYALRVIRIGHRRYDPRVRWEKGLNSIEGVCDVETVAGDGLVAAGPRLLIELPHGATRYAHFERLRARLKSPLPEELRQFFFVNTDVIVDYLYVPQSKINRADIAVTDDEIESYYSKNKEDCNIYLQANKYNI